jgi:hypothetical protein
MFTQSTESRTKKAGKINSICWLKLFIWLLDILNLFNISHYINHIKQTIIQCWIPSESNNSLCSGDRFCLISSHHINHIKQTIIQCWIPSESNNSLCSGDKSDWFHYELRYHRSNHFILLLWLELWSYLFSTRSFGAFRYLSENACPQP